jgi:hypothetical protein
MLVGSSLELDPLAVPQRRYQAPDDLAVFEISARRAWGEFEEMPTRKEDGNPAEPFEFPGRICGCDPHELAQDSPRMTRINECHSDLCAGLRLSVSGDV